MESTHRLTVFHYGLLAILCLAPIFIGFLSSSLPVTTMATYLPLYTTLETVAITLAALIFAVGWMNPSGIHNRNTVLLASVFFVVAFLDFSHLLKLAELPTIPAHHTDIYWLTARILSAVVLLTIALLPWKRTATNIHRHGYLGGGITLLALLNLLTMAHPERMPILSAMHDRLSAIDAMFIYTLTAINGISAIVFYRNNLVQCGYDYRSFFIAAFCLAFSHVSFIWMDNNPGMYQLLGQGYKLVAYIFLYWGIFVANIRAPYQQLNATTRALRLSEARVDRILHSAMDAIIAVDEQQNIVIFNPAAEKMFRCSAADVQGTPLDRFIPERYRQHHQRQMKTFGITGITSRRMGANNIIYGVRTDGEEFPIEASIAHVAVEGQALYNVILRDISERLRIEERLRQQQAELVHSQRLSSIGEISAIMAHEINQPLTVIIGNLESIPQCFPDIKHEPAFDEVLQETAMLARQAAKIVKNIREFVRKQPSSWEDSDINAIIHKATTLLNPEAISKQVKIILSLAPQLPKVQVDALQIEQLLLNLGLNAIDAMAAVIDRERHLAISTRINGNNELEIAVCDSGTGLAPEVAKQLFKPFLTTKPQGLGLGLSLCRSIVETHGGDILVSNNPDYGVTFKVMLPTTGSK